MLGVQLKKVNDDLYEFYRNAFAEKDKIPELVQGLKYKFDENELDIIRPIAILTKSTTASKQRLNNPFFGTMSVSQQDGTKYIDNQYVIQQLIETGYISKYSKFSTAFNTLEKFYIASTNNDMLFNIDGIGIKDLTGDFLYYIIGAYFESQPTLKEIEKLCSEFVIGLKALQLPNMRTKEDYKLLETLRLYRNLTIIPIPTVKPEMEFFITDKQAALKCSYDINLNVFRQNWMMYKEEE